MSEPVGDYLDRLENTHDEHESLLKFLMGMGWKPLECDSIGFLRDYWQTRAALEARLSKMDEGLHEISMRATRHQRGISDIAYVIRDLQAIEEFCEALAGESR